MTGERKKSFFILIVLLCFFLGMLAALGVGIYGDSEQYIAMHIHREPLYPLFLAFFRVVAGENIGIILAVIAQNLLTAFSIFFLIEYLQKRFGLNIFGELVLLVLALMPHLVTRYVSANHIFLENSILSEALCIPLFHFFILFTLKMVFEGKKRDMACSLLFAWLLSMTRGQMMAMILMWVVIVCLQVISRKQYRKLVIPFLALICAFVLRSLSVCTYNYVITGYFMGNTFGPVYTLANILYACDKEDGEVFEEGSPEREFFDRFYDEADAFGANYRYAGDTIGERAAHLEECHDILKCQVIEADISEYYLKLCGLDYYQYNIMADEMASQMDRKLLPKCFGRWLYNYLLLCRNGFIRSIAVVHRWINLAALLIYLTAFSLLFVILRKDKNSKAACMMGIALLSIAANVCSTSMVIMCLSRFMIYGFSVFYMAFFLMIVELLRTTPNWYIIFCSNNNDNINKGV